LYSGVLNVQECDATKGEQRFCCWLPNFSTLKKRSD
jgi:hypothetical protein